MSINVFFYKLYSFDNDMFQNKEILEDRFNGKTNDALLILRNGKAAVCLKCHLLCTHFNR